MTTQPFRFRTAPNGPWVYIRLAAEDGEPLTAEEAAQYILQRLWKASGVQVPWIMVQVVTEGMTEKSLMPWHHSRSVFGNGVALISLESCMRVKRS